MPETQDFSLWPLSLLLMLVLLFVALCIWGVVNIVEANHKKALKPEEKLIGQVGRVLAPLSRTQRGKIHVFGEVWDALCSETEPDDSIPTGAEVRVDSIDRQDARILRVTRLLR